MKHPILPALPLLLALAACDGGAPTPTDFAYECSGTVNDGTSTTALDATFLVEDDVATFSADDPCVFARSYGFDNDFGAVAPAPGFGCPATGGGTIERLVFDSGDAHVGVLLVRPSTTNLAIDVSCELVWSR